MSIKRTLITSISTLATCTFLSSSALAQSTPIPKNDSHAGHNHGAMDDHSERPATEIIEGTFTELESDHVIGSAKAGSTMIIYASVTCPHCAHWFGTVWPDIKKNYVETDQLRVIFREFPTQPAQLAFAGFLIADCAPDDQYFDMIEHQMAEQSRLIKSAQDGFGKEAYLEVAQKAGLADEAAMNECLADKEGIARIQKSMALAQSGNIQSVPNFIIDGTLFKGKTELVPLSAHLDALAEGGATPIP
ncbi:MAG: DsbA family protein [Acidimicrobiales bacterium]|nr:thioredoxin domain-containing protein [Hyphomonadaceae bacterium]RZV36788.1 MAG: DsbA family protein [Acidimicrobiales bacterium]